MPNYTSRFLFHPWHVSGNVYESSNWNVEGITEPDKSCCLVRGINVQSTAQVHGLICNDTDSFSIESAESYNDIRSPGRMNLEQVVIIQDRPELPASCHRVSTGRQARLNPMIRLVFPGRRWFILGASSSQFDGRKDKSFLISSMHSSSEYAVNAESPLFVA